MNMLTHWKKLMSSIDEGVSDESSGDDLLESKPRIRRTGPGNQPVFPPSFEIVAGMLSDTGRHRESNEDFCCCVMPDESEKLKNKGVLALVCDGMGGHAGGEVASRIASEIISRSYYNSNKPPQAALEDAFHEANHAIYKISQKQPHLNGMGTTSTAMAIHSGSVVSAQVGDSRMYLVRGGQIYLMSEDHSAVMEMVRRGQMSIEEARHHEDKNIILRSLGTQREVTVSTWKTSFPARDRDRFVLCSDGLFDMVNDEEIRCIVSDHEPQSACESLIAMANERGGYDNITVGVIKLSHLQG